MQKKEKFESFQLCIIMHCKYKQKKKSLKTNEQKKKLNKKKERQLQQTTKMNL